MSFNRLSSSLSVVVIVGVVGLGFLLSEVYSSLDDASEPAEYRAVKLLASQLAHSLGAAEDLGTAFQRAKQSTAFDMSLMQIDELPLPDILATSLSQGEALLLQSEQADHSMVLSVYLAIPDSTQLLVLGPLPVEQPQPSDATRLVLTLAFYAGLLGVVLLWLAPLLRRLTALRKVTWAFGQGDLQQRLNSQGTSYIAAIEADFNQMADKIQELMADNRLLSRAVSHDLKTPLARLRFGVEMLGQSDDKALRDTYAQRVETDLNEMESLVSTLLDYARMEDNRPSIQLDSIDLNAFLSGLIDKQASHCFLEYSPCSRAEAVVRGDARYLSMLFCNLLNNACAHADSRVCVSVRHKKSQYIVCIEDDGEGIAVADRELVLKPFVRLASGRDKRASEQGTGQGDGRGMGHGMGHGMGLAIANRIAAWHDAQLVLLESKRLGGARAEVVFAAYRSTT